MSYENAPATRMVATSCACCSRPLVDAVSVETGIGPDCRRKHGYATECDDATRDAANKLVHAIAVAQTGPDVNAKCNELRALGFVKLATRIADRVSRLTIRVEGSALILDTPYNEDFVAMMRAIPGRRYDREAGVDIVGRSQRERVWQALCACFPGLTATGPKGLFIIGARAPISEVVMKGAA